jgi:hypothetical protein
VLQPELFIGSDSIQVVPKGKKFGICSEQEPATVVCQRIYSVLRSAKPHVRYTPFKVRKKLVVSLIMPLPHSNYGNFVFSTVDS